MLTLCGAISISLQHPIQSYPIYYSALVNVVISGFRSFSTRRALSYYRRRRPFSASHHHHLSAALPRSPAGGRANGCFNSMPNSGQEEVLLHPGIGLWSSCRRSCVAGCRKGGEAGARETGRGWKGRYDAPRRDLSRKRVYYQIYF